MAKRTIKQLKQTKSQTHRWISDEVLQDYLSKAGGHIVHVIEMLRRDGLRFSNRRMRDRIRDCKTANRLRIQEPKVKLVLDNPLLADDLKALLSTTKQPHIFTFDIETTPLLAFVWGAFKQFLSPQQLVRYNELLSVQFKLLGDNTVYNLTRQEYTHEELTKITHDLLNITDIVVAQNGVQFDVKMMNMFFIEQHLTPPSEYKVIDTFRTAKSMFRFPHKSLAGMGKQLSLKSRKQDNSGFSLWTRCMSGYLLKGKEWVMLGITGEPDPKAWEEMTDYGVHDILATEELYLRMRPWMKTHPNHNLYTEDLQTVCTKCGSDNVRYAGVARTGVNKVYALVCGDCGGRSKDRYTAITKEKRKTIVANG